MTYVNNRSSSQEKIALFRSYFKGREEIYPRRFVSRKTGKAGYSPVCGNEWVRGICEKPRIKCSECIHQRFLPITNDIVHWHLSGRDNLGNDFVMGVYPMLLDETCFFLAADFDKTTWEYDAVAFMKTCHQKNLPAALERSRSGKGAHVWLFFSEPVTASLARKLGCYLLTETMESRPEVGFDSYDRFFPNQDTMPKGGFGNLIALPLQKRAREVGNSVFIDDSLKPFEDQWEFLSSVKKINRVEAENIVSSAERQDKIVGVKRHVDEEDEQTTPWRLPPSRRTPAIPIENIPKTLEVVVGNQLFIAKEGLTPPLRNRLMRLAAFQNPEFYKAQAMRLPTSQKPRIISCAEDYPNHLALPRGCLEDVHKLLIELKIKMTLRYELALGHDIEVAFQGMLQPEQKSAADALMRYDMGVLSATTAFGKTVVAAYLIAKRKVNTLILVHRKQLQEQWVKRLSMFLDFPENLIGSVGGGKRKAKGHIDIALIQSLYRKGTVDDLLGQYGHLIIDECHHLPAQSFEQVVKASKAKYVTGLTATFKRKDGHHPIINMLCGPVRYTVSAKKQAAVRPFEHKVIVRSTGFHLQKVPENDVRLQFNAVYAELVVDEIRNKLICDDVCASVQQGRSPLVLTERQEHLDILFRLLTSYIPHLVVLKGGMGTKEINEGNDLLSKIGETESRVILATGQYIGEGFDDARLDTLFLTLPISWQGTIAQYVGRLHRLCEGKKEVQVYDYADLNVPLLERMFNRRCHGYEAVGYKIMLPASATPGWPLEVTLSADSAWKKDYAASVKRLVKDGIDVPLAKLFVNASAGIPVDAEGVSRARSNTEAFLFNRLETLPQTKGKFELNALLPIAFDMTSNMEVDLLCAEGRLVIELDGEQHFTDLGAYRRDRRKDILLQQHGYMVIRFLTDDVCKSLDDVLDTIVGAVTHRTSITSSMLTFSEIQNRQDERTFFVFKA